MRVLRNTFAKLQGRRASRPAVPVPTEDLDWMQDAGADPTASLLESPAAFAAIAGLSDPLREAIVAVDVVGLPYRDAARALRVREGTIMSRLHRARERVAEALDG
jgi:RNA polymerase sigma-70 factor (ECF subfamily)